MYAHTCIYHIASDLCTIEMELFKYMYTKCTKCNKNFFHRLQNWYFMAVMFTDIEVSPNSLSMGNFLVHSQQSSTEQYFFLHRALYIHVHVCIS